MNLAYIGPYRTIVCSALPHSKCGGKGRNCFTTILGGDGVVYDAIGKING